jgi:hypothetical protein
MGVLSRIPSPYIKELFLQTRFGRSGLVSIPKFKMRMLPNGALVLDYQSNNQLFRKARDDDWMDMSSTRVVGGAHGGRRSIDRSLLDRFVNEFRCTCYHQSVCVVTLFSLLKPSHSNVRSKPSASIVFSIVEESTPGEVETVRIVPNPAVIPFFWMLAVFEKYNTS